MQPLSSAAASNYWAAGAVHSRPRPRLGQGRLSCGRPDGLVSRFREPDHNRLGFVGALALPSAKGAGRVASLGRCTAAHS